MATSMTVLDAVNEIVETVGEFPMTGTAPTGSGTSIYDRAKQFLDRENKRIQSLGWPENTIMCKGIVSDATDGTIKSEDDVSPTPNKQLGTNVLRVRAAGSDAHRTLVLRDSDGVGPPARPLSLSGPINDVERDVCRIFDLSRKPDTWSLPANALNK